MTRFEGIHYLLCALGDGSLFYFNMNVDTGQFYLHSLIGIILLKSMILMFKYCFKYEYTHVAEAQFIRLNFSGFYV